jgi:GAF domain-containing protein
LARGKAANLRRRKAVSRKRSVVAKRRIGGGAGLQEQLEQKTRELNEALEQQAATAEVLGVINASRGDLQPVFEAMVEKARRLCQADAGHLALPIGDDYRSVAVAAMSPEMEVLIGSVSYAPGRGTAIGRALAERRPVQISDIGTDNEHVARLAAHKGFIRTILGVPLLREGEAIGAFGLSRQRIEPFSERQIELVRTFADQAVIAIENARLLSELRESLEQQTATSEVLRVISASPGELEPVFQAMLENAVRICEAKFGNLFYFDGNTFHTAAGVGTPPEYADFQRRRGPFQPRFGSGIERVMRTKDVTHIADAAAETDSGMAAKLGGARSIVYVPMLKDDVLIGLIVIYRQEVRPFPDKQIELVKNFAAQAVIAIENTRLLSELRQSLEQQTATADVLRVISSSPGALEPVFISILDNATRICQANFATLFLREGEALRVAAHHGSLTKEWDEQWQVGMLLQPDRELQAFQTLSGRQPLQVVDLSKAPSYLARNPKAVNSVETGGIRTMITVPMLKDGAAIGVISIFRTEVREFTEKQIALVTNFAAQAVIAIENTRLLNELRQSLEQQTATADVLRVISSSPGELEPVFRAMLENATRICEAKFGTLALCEGDALRAVALHGGREDYADERRRNPLFRPSPNVPVMRAVRMKQVQHVANMLTEQAYIDRDAAIVTMVETGGARTFLAVPMLKDDEAVGVIIVYRQEVRPFTDKQIALVQNFAAQAVIAIENTRLLNELRQRTEDLSKSLEDLRAAQDRLVQTEKLASLGQLTAGIAHEIKNPLNFVNNFSLLSVELIDELQEELGKIKVDSAAQDAITDLAETLKGNLEKIAQHGKRADAIVKNMLLHSREGSGEHRPVDVNALVEESLNLAYHGARAER